MFVFSSFKATSGDSIKPDPRVPAALLEGRKYKFLYIDGANFPVRINGRVSRQSFCAVLGVSEEGQCFEVLALEMGDQEQTDLWETVFRGLLERGLNDEAVELGIMDGLPGLEILFKRAFSRAQTQRCQKHAKARACQRVRKAEREEFSQDVNKFFMPRMKVRRGVRSTSSRRSGAACFLPPSQSWKGIWIPC